MSLSVWHIADIIFHWWWYVWRRDDANLAADWGESKNLVPLDIILCQGQA